MFKPQFSLSGAFENRLMSLRETNDHLRGLTFPHNKMKTLREEALNTSISLIIQPENQRIGYGRVARLLESPFQKPTDESEQPIAAVHAVLKKIRTYTSSSHRYGEDDFIDLYRLLKGDFKRKDQTDKGKKPYRDSHIDIRENSQKKLYDAAPHGDIHFYTSDLFDWLGYESKDVHPIIRAIIAYFQVLIVRPFPSDNCKMAWFLLLSTLNCNDYDFGGYISLEKDIFVSREAFTVMCCIWFQELSVPAISADLTFSHISYIFCLLLRTQSQKGGYGLIRNMQEKWGRS
ncbi:MAG: Fic family protein [Gemmatimonadota bacterium]|nr:MAG: Fic family protein [Gemmatimonadota bacterium]